MNEQNLPTWNDILHNTRASLTTARTSLADARDHLSSDWRPVGTELAQHETDARTCAFELIGQARALIDQAKNVLYDAQR
ncbi:hypothetical protein [Pseudonocardia xinjiangensis]|uniref:Type VII secretion system (Wss) protein ESAT-6 n=1 Tax=Pseudonocardia xinjiangensis TaxID=75289 RepID=A0ABX1RBE4_9PSEU|nr:hypothetical protein [Pseudonocardia xinjiangensis]NMH77712.1 hypothetical protein [Pseudonocardia xinjiangensis]